VRLITLEGRFWKWRMQGGAAMLARRAADEPGPPPDVVVATDMLNLPVWLAGVRRRLPPALPVLLYMHENQLTYPWREGEKPDLTYAMINWLSQLSADRVAFNSRSHLDAWFEELPRLLKHFPDYVHLPMLKEVRDRSLVLPVGIEAGEPAVAQGAPAPESVAAEPPLILWNQRWEYDKRPDRFFALLYRLHEAGVPFRLAVAGENFRNVPAEFEEAHRRLGDHVVHWGYVANRADYRALLRRAALVVSTADHEFFGISVLEAIAAGAFPLLPNRLSYPELLPEELRPRVLYAHREDLYRRAQEFLLAPGDFAGVQAALQAHVCATYGWPTVAAAMDDLLEGMASEGE
jgi:glycosyltransferase involved in cell wall biosynthesis